jgi:hypothetical protein
MFRGAARSPLKTPPSEEGDNEPGRLPLILVAPVDPEQEEKRDGVGRDKVHQIAVYNGDSLLTKLK